MGTPVAPHLPRRRRLAVDGHGCASPPRQLQHTGRVDGSGRADHKRRSRCRSVQCVLLTRFRLGTSTPGSSILRISLRVEPSDVLGQLAICHHLPRHVGPRVAPVCHWTSNESSPIFTFVGRPSRGPRAGQRVGMLPWCASCGRTTGGNHAGGPGPNMRLSLLCRWRHINAVRGRRAVLSGWFGRQSRPGGPTWPRESRQRHKQYVRRR